ncbi:HEAT repeat domain-containing protein [Laspinema palackyanum]|uniref:HEAT repeat domain-containing protein n=1 Tax=Laspinema palackyanum TaxID=3231601 RepID=UPI00345CE002|nr:HEAT repeat domain-containing protein [Laspinema sp. D2c]
MKNKSIDELIDILETFSDEFIRRLAAERLGQIGKGNETAISALVHLLKTTNDELTRIQAAYSLGQIDPGNKTAISALVNLLETTNYEFPRRQAAESLVQIGKGNETAISALVNLLKTTNYESTRIQATYSLVQIGKGNETAISALVNLLETTIHENTRRHAAESLVQIGQGNKTAISALVNLLETTIPENTRRYAAYSLGKIGQGNETAISALANLLETTIYDFTRIQAAESLAQIDPGNKRVISVLVNLLETTKYEFPRRQAAESLVQIGKGNETAISALVNLLETTHNEDIRRQAAESLVQIGKGNETAISTFVKDKETVISALVNLLETSTDETTRRQAVESLVQIGKGNETAISAFVNLLETTTEENTRRQAAESLVQIGKGNETAISALVKLLETTTDEDTHRRAAESLGQIGKGNETAISALVNLLETTTEENTRRHAAESLVQIGKGNETAISALVNLLEATIHENTRRHAAESLVQIGKGNETAISALVNLLETSTDENTRRHAAESLGQIDPGNKTAISALVNLLETTTDERTSILAAHSLGQIDPCNETVISALANLLKTTNDEFTRIQAAYSLGQIDPGNKTAISALVNLLETTNYYDDFPRRQAAESLVQIGKGNETAISALVNLLETTIHENTRRHAAYSLVQIGKGNETAISALVNLLVTTTDKNIGRHATYSLGEIVGISSHLLFRPDQIASSVIDKRQWLHFIWPICAIIFGFLGSLMGTYYIFPIWQNYFVLLLINTSGWLLVYIHFLCLVFLISKSWSIRKTYVYLEKTFFPWLNQQKIKRKIIIYYTQILTHSQDEFVQLQAIKNLKLVANGSKPAIVALIKTLRANKNEFIQWQAIKSLGNIGNNNRKALTAIIKFIETTSNEFIRWQSLEELENFKVLYFSNVIQIRQKLKSNRVPSIQSAILNLQKKLDPLERLILKPFNQRLVKGLRSEYSVKTIFGDSIFNYIDKMQQGQDIKSRRILINSCLEIHQSLVKFALQNKDFNRAFFYTEIFRNRYLVERIAQQDTPFPATISKQLAQNINIAKQRERQTLQAYTDGMNKHLSELELAALSLVWENAKEILENLYHQVAEIEPEFIAKTKVYPISFQEVQDFLPSDTAIIEFFFTENELITLLILPGHESPLIPEQLRVNLKPQNPLERLARAWEEDLKDKSKSKNDAIQTTLEELPRRIDHLGELLNFSELEKYLPRQIQQLIIVPNNSLHLFPIHAVPLNPTQRLIDRFSVRYFPNLQIWKICQNRQRSRDSFLGIENPTQDKDLIFAKAEIASICQRPNFRGKYKVLPRPNAQVKKSEILEEAKNYHCFHFSGHAEYNFKNPLDSYLMLSKDRKDHQEDLTLSNLFADLHLPDADLVTLSACCTGVVDAFQPTDECLGIATGFLLAGAKAVVSSLWKVNSIATAFLLDEFYRQLEQTPDKAVALQNAQNWLRTRTADELIQRSNEWDLSKLERENKLEREDRIALDASLRELPDTPFENPYFWSPFILTGC